MTAAAHFAAHSSIDGQVAVGINAVSLRSDGESTAVDQNKTVRGSGRGKPILLTHSKAGTAGPTGGIEPIALGGLAAVLILLLLLSKRIVRPVAESYEKQKQFITDAGHELKTPLTIIGADADLAEMECGENQWIQDIRRQTQRLTELTQDLIYLSRVEEEGLSLQSIDFPLSDVAEEMAHSFLPLAQNQGKRLEIAVQPMLSFRGDEKSIRQPCSILLDNALKYSPQEGELLFRLEKQGKNILLSVSNTTSQPIKKEELCHLFDRFYRTDPSRNSQTGGYGLGLSIARSIVTAHKGKIRAESPQESVLTIQVTLPS